jgi:DNA end-binding protein Ku
VRPVDGVLRMQVMRFADQLVPGGDLGVEIPGSRPGTREIDMARTLVDSLCCDFDPAGYEDTYRARVLELVRRKERGEEIEAPEPEPREEPDDLLAALHASLEATKKEGS